MANGNQQPKHVFIKGNDELATIINSKANLLYSQLGNFDTAGIEIAAEYRDYFIRHHLGRRLFFSMQNSAHIIYHSVKKTGRAVHEISFIDYGAGLGTLFMLAGMMGFRKNVYNDYLPDWQQTAAAICNVLNITVTDYVTGDIDAVIKHAAINNIQYDIVASRNVVEHIYSLPHFYNCIYKHNPATVVYSTTTANYHNPAQRWHHIRIHKKGEDNFYRQQRADAIKKLYPTVTEQQLSSLTELTRGKAQDDFTTAVKDFLEGKKTVADSSLRSNSCDCITGVWNEHLLSKAEHNTIIHNAGFKMEYLPGYWDTHYTSGLMNVFAAIMNRLILLLGNKGIWLSPFVNIIAYN